MIQNIYRQSETDDDSDTDSTAELECDTWNDACAWEFDYEYPEKLRNGGYVDGDIQYPRVCVRNNDNRLYPKLPRRLCVPWVIEGMMREDQ